MTSLVAHARTEAEQWLVANTPFDPATPTHDPAPRPFRARTFGRREIERRNVYGFDSIKECLSIEVDGLTAIGIALELECEPAVAAFTERPRKLEVGDGIVELDFWVRYRSGREEFLLSVSEVDCITAPGGKRTPRELQRLNAAAYASSINVHFITEHDIRVHGARLMVNNRLLAFTQVAQQLDNALALRKRILDHMEAAGRARIDQIEQALVQFCPWDVQAVVCELVYLGALTFDRAHGLTRRTVVQRRNLK